MSATRLKAFVQKVNNEFSHVNYFTAYQGLSKHQGYDVQFFERDELDSLPITKETPVSAGIETMNRVFARFGKTAGVPYYPEELKYLLGRQVTEMTMQDLRARVEDNAETYFIKPLESAKKTFNGHVAGAFRDLIYTAHIPNEQVIVASEPVEFVTEYRFFVHKEHGIMGMKHYAGKWQFLVDYSVAEAAIKAYTKSPVAYSLDLGLTADGKTLLVECNDVTSLGSYGLPPAIYSKLIVDRWHEIMAS